MDFWEALDAVVLDMDGVIFIGQHLRQGVIELLQRFTEARVRYHVLTNTSASSRTEISAKLARMGLALPPEQITNASEVAVSYIQEQDRAAGAVTQVLTLGGGNGLARSLKEAGIQQLALEQLSAADIKALNAGAAPTVLPLIIGWTRGFDFEVATRVLELERCIGEVYTASADRFFADDGGNTPAVGWLSAAVGALLGKEPLNVAKPNPYSLQYVLGKLGSTEAATAVIGDSLSDIEMGKRAGCRTVLVLGGATNAGSLEALSAEAMPSRVINELTDLL